MLINLVLSRTQRPMLLWLRGRKSRVKSVYRPTLPTIASKGIRCKPWAVPSPTLSFWRTSSKGSKSEARPVIRLGHPSITPCVGPVGNHHVQAGSEETLDLCWQLDSSKCGQCDNVLYKLTINAIWRVNRNDPALLHSVSLVKPRLYLLKEEERGVSLVCCAH